MRRGGAATFATIVACTGPSHALDRLSFDQLIFQAAREARETLRRFVCRINSNSCGPTGRQSGVVGSFIAYQYAVT